MNEQTVKALHEGLSPLFTALAKQIADLRGEVKALKSTVTPSDVSQEEQGLVDALSSALVPLHVEQATATKQLRDWTTDRFAAVEQRHDVENAALRTEVEALKAWRAEVEQRAHGELYVREYASGRSAR